MEASSQLHAPAALPSGNESKYQLDRRLGRDTDGYINLRYFSVTILITLSNLLVINEENYSS
jgi:hypothetical protein